jgi:hypothetical protein
MHQGACTVLAAHQQVQMTALLQSCNSSRCSWHEDAYMAVLPPLVTKQCQQIPNICSAAACHSHHPYQRKQEDKTLPISQALIRNP